MMKIARGFLIFSVTTQGTCLEHTVFTTRIRISLLLIELGSKAKCE